METEVFIWTLASLTFIFILFHIRPLRAKEVNSLGRKRRRRKINRYFKFSESEKTVNQNFKKKMNPNGKFYSIDLSLYNFPSLAAALLKYKKHEWILIGFEKDKRIKSLWMNKGSSRDSVASELSTESMVFKAQENSFSSILILHNHPNINPVRYDCTKPSKQDIATAKEASVILNEAGINLLEFICERGRYYHFFQSISQSFIPLDQIVTEITSLNGKSRWVNFRLHMERLF